MTCSNKRSCSPDRAGRPSWALCDCNRTCLQLASIPWIWFPSHPRGACVRAEATRKRNMWRAVWKSSGWQQHMFQGPENEHAVPYCQPSRFQHQSTLQPFQISLLKKKLFQIPHPTPGAPQGHTCDPNWTCQHHFHPFRIMCFGPKIGPINRPTLYFIAIIIFQNNFVLLLEQ